MTKVLMLNPPWVPGFTRSARWACRSRGRVQRHPDWMLVATAVLTEAGHEVKFVDGAAQNLSRLETERVILDFSPGLCVCHTTTPSIVNDIEYARFAKKSVGSTAVLVGPHVSAETENTFDIAGDGVDVIVRGEYDYTLRDLAGGGDLTDIMGLSFQTGENIIHNPARPPIDVDELPFPAWHHIKPEWYPDAGKLYPFLTLLSGRGCHGHCTFCRDTPTMYGHTLRMREPGRVVDEMEYDLKLFPEVREIMFETDTFTASAEHVRGVCQEILDRKLKVTWSCNVRVDADLTLLPLMKRAGCRMLMIGFEFGTQKALDAVKKGITLAQSKKFSKEARRLGFTQHGCFMIGAPGETREDARATIDFAKSLPLDTVQFSGICVYPGTELYDWAKENGYLVPKDWHEWVNPECEQVTLLSYPQLPKEEIDGFIDQGLREFYLRPGQIVRMAANMRNLGDVKRKLYGLRSFADYFTLP